MARTSSQKLDFWQFEVGLFNDMKMVDLNEKYGTLGEAVYFRILSYIADSEGYYAVLSDSLVLSIYRSIGSKWIKDKRVILRIIHYCGECGLFDVSLLSQNVITSCGIQRRWLYAKEKSRAKGFTTDRFWLLDGQRLNNCTQNENKCSNNDYKCSNNENNCNNNLPYISKVNESKETPNPLQGGGSDIWKDKFFERYTVFEKKNYHDDGVDYEVLYREFEQSATLQKMWSFPKVIKIYQQIANGDFRDKQQPTYVAPAVSAANARADREKFYAQRRNAAQAKADKMMERAMRDNDFKQATHRISWMQMELARAEVNGNNDTLQELTRQQAILQNVRAGALKALGLTEEDLLPKWYCKKCSDTGYLPNGTACDCYKKAQG